MKFYDRKNNCLVFIEERTDSNFWDSHWDIENFREQIKKGEKDSFIKKYTEKYLDEGIMVLEGGCGRGSKVYGLKQWGYDAYGIDFAKRTIKKINKCFPNLKIIYGDVRNLPYKNNFFDAYWSLGVIEHFYNGYNDIVKEMQRVIKKGGYLFLTFPYMSPLRKMKVVLNMYKDFDQKMINISNFYQFALDKRSVIDNLKKRGFELIKEKPFDGIKGLKDEVAILKSLLQKIYDSKSIFGRGLSFLISKVFERLSGHMILLILQKRNKNL